MRYTTFEELRNKEVIDIRDGRRLGYICDIEVDLECGRVIAVIVPGPFKFFCFPQREEYRIPWECITKISTDIILVCCEILSLMPQKGAFWKKK